MVKHSYGNMVLMFGQNDSRNVSDKILRPQSLSGAIKFKFAADDAFINQLRRFRRRRFVDDAFNDVNDDVSSIDQSTLNHEICFETRELISRF